MFFFSWPFFGYDWLTLGIFLSIVFLIIGISEIIRAFSFLSNENNRRFVHILVGLFCSVSPNLFQSNFQPLILGLLFLVLNTIALKIDIFKGIHSLKRVSYGTIYFPISYTLLVAFFWEYPSYITISLALLSFADPAASFVGQKIKNPYTIYPWYDKKSIQGSITMFIISFIIVYLLTPSILPFFQINIFYFSLFLSLLVTLAELVSCKGSDNFSVPILSFIGIHCYQISVENFEYIMFGIIIIFFIAFYFKAVDFSGLFGGCIMAFIVLSMGGFKYLIPLCVFFIFSSLISKIIGFKDNHLFSKPKRNILQVISNGGVGLTICITAYFTSDNGLLFFLFLSSISAANSDTWATEIGRLSKKNPISIVNFMPIERGLSGGITIIGTLGSILGSAVIAITGYIFGIEKVIFIGILVAGVLGSLFDSLLGATIQAKFITSDKKIVETYTDNSQHLEGIKWVDNNFINFLCTLSAPIFMYIYLLWFYFD